MSKLVALVILLFSLKSFSLETDQFMTWEIELNNSKDFVNRFINENIEMALQKVNQKNPEMKCERVAIKALDWNGRTTDFLSLIEKTTYEHPEVDRWPAINVSQKGVIEESIYANVDLFKHKVFGVNIQLDGIYMGTDKLGHFITVGLSYYKKYLSAKRKGFDKEKSIIKAIRRGVFSEETYYGNIISGVFSFADLEANYQGLKFAMDLCEGENPLLIKDKKGNWTLREKFDITPYLNPNWDESWNPSTYVKRRWKQVQPKLMEYCEKRFSPAKLNRFKYYQSIHQESESTLFLQKLIKKGKVKSQENYLLENICPN